MQLQKAPLTARACASAVNNSDSMAAAADADTLDIRRRHKSADTRGPTTTQMSAMDLDLGFQAMPIPPCAEPHWQTTLPLDLLASGGNAKGLAGMGSLPMPGQRAGLPSLGSKVAPAMQVAYRRFQYMPVDPTARAVDRRT